MRLPGTSGLGMVVTVRRAALTALGIAVTLALGGGCHSAGPSGTASLASLGQPGLGAFTFRPPGPLSDRPVRVFYRLPTRPRTASVVVVMPGQGRDARRYRREWVSATRGKHIILLVPRFSDELYSGFESYNVGNMIDNNGSLNDTDHWSFQVIEALFAAVTRRLDSAANSYMLFGHSAGAQFVHRFIEFMPDNHVATAVAANAGWYTVVDDDTRFPYGLGHSPVHERDLRRAFSSKLVILLGADDIDPHDGSLRRDDASDEQGRTRLERGMNFYLTARMAAADHDFPFDWKLVVTPAVAHSDGDMAPVATRLLLSSGDRGHR